MYPSPLTLAYAQDPRYTPHSVWKTVPLTHRSLRTGKTHSHGCGSAKGFVSLPRRLERLWFHAHSWPGSTGTFKQGYSGQGAKLTSHHYLGYVEL